MKLFSRSYVCFNSFFIIILLNVTQSTPAPKEVDDVQTVYELINDKFNELLDIIAKMNEEKNNVLKRIVELENYEVGNSILRFVDEEEGTLVAALLLYNKYPAIVDALFKMDEPNEMKGRLQLRNKPRLIDDYYDYFEISAETNNKLFDWRKNIKNIYRNETEKSLIEADEKREKVKSDYGEKIDLASALKVDTANVLRGGCWKRALKLCKRACKAAWKSVCREYYCRRSMKKYFKKNCKAECKSEFDD